MGSFTTSLTEIFNTEKKEFDLLIKDKKCGKICIRKKLHNFRPTFFNYIMDGE